jgi:ComF family protein
MTTAAQRIARVALDLVFPPQCALCGEGGTLLCDECIAALPRADGSRCDRCSMPSRDATCAHCIAEPPSFTSLQAAFIMEGGARRLAHELKYEGMTSLAEPMAALMAPLLRHGSFDTVTAVPLHPKRQRSRGYNQSAELARRLAATAGVLFDGRIARRVRDTAPLAKSMNRQQRREIVDGAFSADPKRAEGRRLLVIDDVCTTGATLDACSRALLDAGAASVACLVWARAD